MLDTDYPYFPDPNPDAVPLPAAKSLANLTGFAECQLLLLAKKCANQLANFPVLRPKNPFCTQVPGHSALSRGTASDEILG